MIRFVPPLFERKQLIKTFYPCKRVFTFVFFDLLSFLYRLARLKLNLGLPGKRKRNLRTNMHILTHDLQKDTVNYARFFTSVSRISRASSVVKAA